MDEDSKRIQKQLWYHGMRPRSEVEPLLEKSGDFLVRARISKPGFELVLSYHCGKRIQHLSLWYDKQCGGMDFQNRKKTIKSLEVEGKPRFKMLSELIGYYKKKPLSGTVCLMNSIHRPSWLIAPSSLRTSPQQGELGKGNFAVVYRGIYENPRHSLVHVAIKQLNPPEVVEGNEEAANEACKAIFHEAHLMSRLTHPNIVMFYGLACDSPPVMVVMELASGSLDKHLTKFGDAISDAERLLFILEAARGITYLHKSGMIHRDLAVRNCLIGENGIIKISDFGLSEVIEKIGENIPTKLPLRWMAPEVISRTPTFSFKSDCWSYGVLIYEVWNNGIKPWPEEENRKISKFIRKCQMPKLPTKMPSEIEEMVKQCWQMEAKKRPDFIDVIQKLLDAQKKNSQLTRPSATECTTNQIPGVTRIDPAEEDLEASITGYLNPSTLTPTMTTTSEGSKDLPSADEIKPDVSESKKKHKHRHTFKKQSRNL